MDFGRDVPPASWHFWVVPTRNVAFKASKFLLSLAMNAAVTSFLNILDHNFSLTSSCCFYTGCSGCLNLKDKRSTWKTVKILNQESNVKENMFRLFMPSPLHIHGIGILTYMKTITKINAKCKYANPMDGMGRVACTTWISLTPVF